uniref:Sulfatase N-terminal domain-containing protein n=1 Tax=Strigamia maritima TaxID=126957 RepID=T1JN66_STRMM
MGSFTILLCLQFLILLNVAIINCKPNILFILSDDQDVTIGGLKPMAKTKKLITEKGLTFTNAFASTPICCPSRSSILTGLYLHNHGVVNNSLHNCSSSLWQNGPELRTYATYVKKQNYMTFYAGKYLNQYGFIKAGGVKHIPAGWDHWYGLVGNSRYYNYTLSVNGKAETHGDHPRRDYLTDVINRRATKFLDRYNPETDKPFLMVLATPACHSPFTPSPKYKNAFPNVKAPRTKNFNITSHDKHWLLRQTHPLKDFVVDKIDDIYRNRWRTLLSVDDMVENMINLLEKKDIINNTYIFYSSDHGYHLGQFSLPMDKRQLYEMDVRIPLMVRGPGIPINKTSKSPIVSIDFAPTFIELAGGQPEKMDGISMVPLLHSDSNFRKDWKRDFLIEYVGEGKNTPVPGCPTLAQGGVNNCFPDCICEDAFNNTYSCIRTLSQSGTNKIYCEFKDNEHFVEMYNMKVDPMQLKNLAICSKEKKSCLNKFHKNPNDEVEKSSRHDKITKARNYAIVTSFIYPIHLTWGIQTVTSATEPCQ